MEILWVFSTTGEICVECVQRNLVKKSVISMDIHKIHCIHYISIYIYMYPLVPSYPLYPFYYMPIQYTGCLIMILVARVLRIMSIPSRQYKLLYDLEIMQADLITLGLYMSHLTHSFHLESFQRIR